MSVNWETWIAGRMAEHRRAELARNAPISRAYDALTVLRETLLVLDNAERGEIVRELCALLEDQADREWQTVGDSLDAVGRR